MPEGKAEKSRSFWRAARELAKLAKKFPPERRALSLVREMASQDREEFDQKFTGCPDIDD